MKKTLGLSLALGLTLSGLPTISNAAEVQPSSVVAPQKEVLSEELIKEIKNNFTIGGISEEIQIKLIEKLKKGELLDAQNPAKLGTGYTKTKEYLDENGILNTEKKTTYLDGSVTLESITGGTVEEVEPTSEQESVTNGTVEEVNPTIQRSISGGTSRTGSGYVNYYGRKVSRLSGAVHSSFKADYSHVKSGNDSLSRIYEWDISGVGSLGNIELKLVRGSETSSKNAYGYLRFTGTISGNYTTTFYHKIYVGGDKAWDTGNW